MQEYIFKKNTAFANVMKTSKRQISKNSLFKFKHLLL